MKRVLHGPVSICLILACLIGMISCNKDISSARSGSSTTNSVSTNPFIAVAADSTGTDSVYILQPCARGYFRDSVAATDLPAAISTYLSSNYPGNNFEKAFVVKDSAGTIGAYVVIVQFNNKPVGLLFDSKADFVGVLEQREAGDLHNNGYHDGGRFQNRDHHYRDTVALSSLPASVQSYMTTNYPQDTLLKAFMNIDSSYLLISANNGLYANLFSAGGDFEKRVLLPSPGGVVVSLAETDLPANIISYLNTTYPDNVFEKAFSLSINTVLKGFLVVIDANNTRYAVEFDAAGDFVSAGTIW